MRPPTCSTSSLPPARVLAAHAAAAPEMPPAASWGGGLESLWADLPSDETCKEMPSAVKAEEEIQKFTARWVGSGGDGARGTAPRDAPRTHMPHMHTCVVLACVRAWPAGRRAQVDEHLSEVERSILYLNGGQLIQQRHAIAK